MCGIAGVLRQDHVPVDARLLRRMTGAIAHRGPDGEGFRVDGAVGLGHRRLAIIDLVTGAQPMGSEDGGAWIIYNGEVYNYRELREELAALGFAFRTTSDTEVILRAYEAWGVDCLPRLRGMFAFAVWDARRRRLLLARDRVGIKPLVYAWDGRALRFASEPKALLADPAVPRELDWEAIRDYFTYLCVPSPRTIFRAIRKLPPASYLVCSLDGGPPEVHRYWELRMAPDPRVSEVEWIDGLSHVLRDTVRRHLVSDVPIGAFLSGGVDSSTVVACMARSADQPIRTFSIGFDEQDFDELAYARLVARRYATDHFELVVKPDVVDILPRLAWQFDEPFADASAVPTYCVSKITREHVTVALSGDGGDENFAGYRRYAEAMSLHRRAEGSPLAMVKPLLGLAAACLPPVRGRGFLELLSLPPVLRYYRMMTYQRDGTLAALLTPEANREVAARTDPESYERLAEAAEAAGARDYLSRLQYIDVHHYLPADILTKVDRTSMLVSLEARVPLLDHVLMEYVATIPPTLKLKAGVGKYILKRAMEEHLPPEVLKRRKMGFGVPLATWLRNELREFARDLLTNPRACQRGIIRREAPGRLLDTHLAGRRDCSAQIWSLICFELWCRTWLDQ
jgi:asparagine synthase (glutamine-hydrolysing)